MDTTSRLVAGVLASLLLGVLANLSILGIERSRKMRQQGSKSPHSVVRPKEPLAGIDILLETTRAAKEYRYLDLVCERHRRYGNTFVTRRLLYETINTKDPENLKQILAIAFEDFSFGNVRTSIMRPLFGNGIFTSEGSTWAHSRHLLRPALKKNNMAPLMRMMERHFQIMLKSIPADGTPVDLQPLFFSFTMDTATEFLFGRSTHTLDPDRSSDKEAAFVHDYVSCCVEAVRRMRMSPVKPLWYDRHFEAAKQRAWAYLDHFVDEAIKLRDCGQLPQVELDGQGDDDISVEYNFLREIALASGDRTFLRDQILNVLLASRDTTAGLLSCLFFVLARRDDVYQRLRAEVETHFGSRPPTQEALKRATYLDWCIKETLRLFPTVPANGRQAIKDTWLPTGGGSDGREKLFVSKGTYVLYSVWALHRSEEIFGADAAEFNPDRWDGLRPGWGFLPFNGGPRICLGQQFALTEATYIVVRLIQSFAKIEPRDERPWTEKHTLALCSRNGVWCALNK